MTWPTSEFQASKSYLARPFCKGRRGLRWKSLARLLRMFKSGVQTLEWVGLTKEERFLSAFILCSSGHMTNFEI